MGADGNGSLPSSPFKSGSFWAASLVAVGCIGLCGYTIFRYWGMLDSYFLLLLGSLIGVQLIYQWWRAVRYYSRLRRLYEMESPLGVALRTAADEMSSLLFFSYGTIAFALVLMDVLLARLNRVR